MNQSRRLKNRHAEQFVAEAQSCHILPDDVPWDVSIVLAGAALGGPYHESLRTAWRDVQTVAVYGVGPVGLGHVLLQAHLGRRVIALDRPATRRERARSCGAAEVVNPDDSDPVEAVKALTGGKGADVCIVRDDSPGSTWWEGNIPCCPAPSGFIDRDFTGGLIEPFSYCYSEFDPILDLYRRGLDVTKLISHRFLSSEAHEAYEVCFGFDRDSARVMLTWPPEEDDGLLFVGTST